MSPDPWGAGPEPPPGWSAEPSHAYRFVRKVMVGRQQEEVNRVALQYYLRSNAERFAG